MPTPLVSIITPAYYGQHTIKRAVDSVLQQDFSDWEMIIINDDNIDYQEILAQQFISDSRLKFTSTNKIKSGASNARNCGLKIAQGQYIASLDCDDAFKPHKLSSSIPLVQKYGAAVSNIEYRDSDSGILLPNLNKKCQYDFLSVQDAPLACAQAYTLYIYDRQKINVSYDIDILRGQDLIFLMSFFDFVEKIGFHSQPLHIYYRRQGSSCNSSDTPQMSFESKLKMLEKLNNNQLNIHNHQVKNVLKQHIELLLKVEYLYQDAVKDNPHISYFNLFKNEIDNISY